MSGHNGKVLERSKTKGCDATAVVQRGLVGLRPSTKIHDHHLDRLAMVYVRQSSPQQVLENRESRERQYALADLAAGLGWPADRVIVIDEDQGLSGKFSENRNGFQRLLTEVTMDHVGLVLGLELSRLARSCKDWHHLVEVCAVFDTLLYDQDGIYDANDSNDRLLLGMKGAMSEFELITLRNRLQRGRENKAQRGEWFAAVPIGYLKLPTGEVVLEPDEQARAVVQLIFDKFQELGTARGVCRYLIHHNIRLGFRCHKGPKRGQLEWRRPQPARIVWILRHPIYAGVYGYPLHQEGRKHPGTGRSENGILWLPPEQMRAFLPDRLPAYISWEQCQANRQRLQQNRSQLGSRGTPRRGEALLAGLATCGNCNGSLRPVYPEKKTPHYTCDRHLRELREQTCYGLKGAGLDALVSQQVLRALEPAALELSLRAVQDVEGERQQLHRQWKQRLERVRYESERVERQYQAVDPDNRLVARTLEARWDESLRNERQLREEYDRFLQQTTTTLSDADRARIRALSADITTLWHAPQTTAADRKEIIRCLVARVVVHVQPKSEHVDVTLHWHGGFTSQHEIVRPVGTFKQLNDYDHLIERIVQLRREGNTYPAIALQLNTEGFVPARRKGCFRADTARTLLLQSGLRDESTRVATPEPDEWLPPVLAQKLKVGPQKIYYWIQRGWVHSRRILGRHRWLVWADRREMKRLEKLKTYCTSWALRGLPELTTPSSRSKKK
jgi:DNA invertase Pin-like site-specific DNA recombinase